MTETTTDKPGPKAANAGGVVVAVLSIIGAMATVAAAAAWHWSLGVGLFGVWCLVGAWIAALRGNR